MSGGQREPQHMTASQLSKQYQSVLKPANKPEHEISQVTSTDDKYEVKLSIHEFEPHELSVKVVDRYVHVEGRHEEKNDKIGFFTRKFTRSYFLPEGAQPESVRCTFNIDTKLLTVTAPIVVKKPAKEYIIPVIIVGSQPVHRSRSQEAKVESKEDTRPRERERERERERDREPASTVPKTPSKKGKVPKSHSEEKPRVKKEEKTPIHTQPSSQQQTVHYAQIQHHHHHTPAPPPQQTSQHHHHQIVEGHHHTHLPPPPQHHVHVPQVTQQQQHHQTQQPLPPQHQHQLPQHSQRDHSHFHQHQHQLQQHQHQSRSEHHLTAVSRQHSQPPQQVVSGECQHELHSQKQSTSQASASVSAPTTATRPHRPKQQYPDHQEIDRLLLQQLMEQQARQRLHQQQQQHLYQMHQQQYQQQYHQQPPK